MNLEEANSLKPGDKVYLVLSGSLQSGPTISEFRVDDLSSLKDGVLCVSRPHPYQMARIRERFSFEHLLLLEEATAKLKSLKAEFNARKAGIWRCIASLQGK